MKIKLVTDCSANYSPNITQDISYVPLKIVTDEAEYLDTPDLDIPKMLVELQNYKGKSGTACPGISDWIDAFGDADIVYGASLTSALSGCYNAGVIAAKEYMDSHEGAQVFLLDSLSTGPELQLIMEKYQEMIEAGMGFHEICKAIVQYRKTTKLMFSLESLDNLAKNGRVNPVVAKAIGLLGIRIVGQASREGTLEPLHKCRGEKKALEQLFSSMEESGFHGGKVRFSHSYNAKAVKVLEDMIIAKYPDCDISVTENRGLCCFYAESGSVLVGFET